MNLAQCLSLTLGVISWERAHEDPPKAPRGHVAIERRVRTHEAPDLSLYASHKVGLIHQRIIALVLGEKRAMTIEEIDSHLKVHTKKRVMSAACYLARIGRIVRYDGPGRKCSYGPPEAT